MENLISFVVFLFCGGENMKVGYIKSPEGGFSYKG